MWTSTLANSSEAAVFKAQAIPSCELSLCISSNVQLYFFLKGADLVVHSATKFLGGHHDLLAGAVVGSSELVDPVRELVKRLGLWAAPLDAWLAVRGIRTLQVGREVVSALGKTGCSCDLFRFVVRKHAFEGIWTLHVGPNCRVG
jgi:O-acetylhomoserine/O-acetylserine sulfhydrylase-like pyridoxal-dependent enzyme